MTRIRLVLAGGAVAVAPHTIACATVAYACTALDDPALGVRCVPLG